MKRLGVDVGGTFTDAVLYDEDTGLVESAKASSTHPRSEQGVLDTLRKLDGSLGDDADIRYLVHGTTVATNAAIERNGPRIAHLTTDGFRDVLEIARLMRTPEEIYDLRAAEPFSLVARRDRLEIGERLGPAGEVRTPLDESTVRRAASVIRGRGITSVSVSLLYAYVSADHERRVAEILREEIPDVQVSLSSEVLPEHREFERSATTALNAYLAPITSSYIERLNSALDGWRAGTPLWIMQSNGGVASPERAAARPVTLLLSGPSGGVVAGRMVAEQAGLTNSITVDMGGTSFDASLLPGNEPTITHERPFMGLPIPVPSVDVLAIGAGGGSIGWVDRGGQFRVGPRSAGAQPGPVCYGRGGEEPTVTDANLVLGVLGDTQRLGGEVTLDVDASMRAFERLGSQLGTSAIEAAWGLRTIVNTAMAGTVRAVSVGRGHDPRDFGLIAFGGAGPMHAMDIADELRIPTVVLPPVPGCHSAVGLVVSDVSRDYVTTLLDRADVSVARRLDECAKALQATAHDDLDDEGIDARRRDLFASLDMRYVGQQFSVNVPASLSASGVELAEAVARFHATHERLYGFSVEGEPVEIVNLRLHATGRLGIVPASPSKAGSGRTPTPAGHRAVVFGLGPDDTAKVPIYDRSSIVPGSVLDGPLIIEQDDTTSIVPPGCRIAADSYGNIVIRRTT